jgi:hypothetical protein
LAVLPRAWYNLKKKAIFCEIVQEKLHLMWAETSTVATHQGLISFGLIHLNIYFISLLSQ